MTLDKRRTIHDPGSLRSLDFVMLAELNLRGTQDYYSENIIQFALIRESCVFRRIFCLFQQ